MGMRIPVESETEDLSLLSQNWPRILLIGAPDVGKRTILNRLLAMGKSRGLPFSTSCLLCHGCTIDTKYYTVDVCISTATLINAESHENVKEFIQSEHCQALIFIFDLSNVSTFEKIQEWVSRLDLEQPEILLCVGNKADRLPGHFGHLEYRRRLQKRGESSSDPHPEFADFGIQQSEGSSLLRYDGDPVNDDVRSQFVEWCMEHRIEYLEACGADHLFDQCMSVDGDSQGLSRIWGALSAHMWPGMVLKSEDSTLPTSRLEDESSEEGSIVIEYERLSNGSIDLWDDDHGPWSFYESSIQHEPGSEDLPNGGPQLITPPHDIRIESNDNISSANTAASTNVTIIDSTPHVQEDRRTPEGVVVASDNSEDVHQMASGDQANGNVVNRVLQGHERVRADGHRNPSASFDDFEGLMSEMARMRDNARMMSDHHRREVAASLALRMASLFDEDD